MSCTWTFVMNLVAFYGQSNCLLKWLLHFASRARRSITVKKSEEKASMVNFLFLAVLFSFISRYNLIVTINFNNWMVYFWATVVTIRHANPNFICLFQPSRCEIKALFDSDWGQQGLHCWRKIWHVLPEQEGAPLLQPCRLQRKMPEGGWWKVRSCGHLDDGFPYLWKNLCPL